VADRPASGESVVPGDPLHGEGQGSGKRKARRPRTSPSELLPDERFERGLNAALRLLDHRERSRVEIRARLRQKGYDAETIDRVLARLEENDLQSDRRFASAFASDAHRTRGLSSHALQGELRRRGIDATLAAEAATERPEDEEARARALVARRVGRLVDLPPDVAHRRILGLLARRGYHHELCHRLAIEALDLLEVRRREGRGP
jgi:regulatory protein